MINTRSKTGTPITSCWQAEKKRTYQKDDREYYKQFYTHKFISMTR